MKNGKISKDKKNIMYNKQANIVNIFKKNLKQKSNTINKVKSLKQFISPMNINFQSFFNTK